jgi:branched-chain amino acid transport system permease protein
VFVFALAAIGLNLLMGLAGQVSLGHAGFMGIGAYAVAIGPAHLGVPSWLSLIMGAALSALVAYLVGRPILRLKGHYLAVATLGFGLLLAIVFNNEAGLTGGPDGMPVPPLSFFGTVVTGERVWYWIVAAALVLAVTLAQNLIESPRGRALRALHGSEVAAASLGVDPARHKLGAFVLSAVLAAVAGALMAHYSGFITPAKASFLHSIELVTMVVFGGMASTFGAVIGAAVLTTLPQLLTVLKEYEMVTLGAVMMLTMIVMPAGLVPTLEKALAAARGKPL